MDKLIHVWLCPAPSVDQEDNGSHVEPLFTLVGHTDTVSALHVLPGTLTLISGSWDKTARVWDKWQCTQTFGGHGNAVWGVLALHATTFVTTSADKLIRVWKSGKCAKTISGHSDVVRSLARVDARSFASCSNDGSVRVWDLEGACLRQLFGHTSFVYSVAVMPGGDLVSSGEDRSIRIWQGEMCVETILLPAQSVWCIAVLKNGDIVSGANDGVVRVFTTDAQRIAEESVLASFQDSVSKVTLNAKELGDIQKEKIPSIDVLSQPGVKDQEVKMVKTAAGVVEAHQWSTAQGQWMKLGEVVDAVGSSRKQIFEGREYDYVFDVDIQEGAPPLKLPYNVTENPYMAAQLFIQRNELPVDYLDQVANFIVKNTQGTSIGAGSAPASADPYSGSRYTPGSLPTQSAASSSVVTGGLSDPFTGLSATSNQPKILPLAPGSYLNFKAANVDAALKKMKELCDKYGVNAAEMGVVEKSFALLRNDRISDKLDFNLLQRLINEWDNADLFPVFDLLRLSVFYMNNIINFPSIQQIMEKSHIKSESELSPATVLTALRLVANMFSVGMFKDIAVANSLYILASIIQNQNLQKLKTANKNVSIAISTILLNYSILLVHERSDVELALEITSYLCEHCLTAQDEEDLYRSLVAVGNLVSKYPQQLKQVLTVLEFPGAVLERHRNSSIQRIKNIANEVMHLL